MANRTDKKASEALLDKSKPWEGDAAVEPQFFALRAQLLDAGNTEEPLAVADHLWLKIKVYAKGGENHLHAHPHQDHSFIILDGRARFHGPRGEERELGRNDGILLPAGCYYWFETISEEPLVVLRVGATTGDGHPDSRTMDGGETKIRRGRDETFISTDVKYRDGAFYG
jgi:mannose-6-phosphate isomerase-like protein (cupin superfamily)